jgi:hypothetical protein
VIDLKPACHRMIEVLAGVAGDQLTSSSPCAEYTVGDLIDHVDQVSRGAIALAHHTAELPRTGTGPARLGHRQGDRTALRPARAHVASMP